MNNWSKKIIGKLQEKNGEHKNIRGLFFELVKFKGYVLNPTALTMLFYEWLKENHKSNMNATQARNMRDVYCILCNVYFIAVEKYKIKNAFAVAKRIWNKHCIKQAALTNSIKLLKEMGLVEYYNYCYKFDPTQRKRFYKLSYKMLEFRIKEFMSKIKAPEFDELDEFDELNFNGWGKFKGRKKKINYSPKISDKSSFTEPSEPEPTDYDDINDLLDDGWYFC